MHGIIFKQLQQFIVTNYSYDSWFQILDVAGLKGKIYYPAEMYPDNEAQAIISSVCQKLDLPANVVLEKFGEFIAPSLLTIYSASIKPNWKLLDLLQHTEDKMHKAVRFSDKSASPPALSCKRIAPDQVIMEYSSPRKMIDLGIGIIKGFANHYKENITIDRTEIDGKTSLRIKLV